MANKFCIRCNKKIDENKNKYVMIITKIGNKILEFECFHFSCWRDYMEFNLRLVLGSKF